MEMKFRLGSAEMQDVREHVQARLRGQGMRSIFWRALLAGMLIGLIRFMHGGAQPSWLQATAWCVLAGMAAWPLLRLRYGRYARWLRQTGGDYSLLLTAEGITSQAPDGRAATYAWPEVTALESSDSFLYFYLHNGAAIIAPAAVLDGGPPDLAAEARRLWTAHPDNAGQTLSETPGQAEHWLRQCGASLRQAARLLAFLDFDPWSFRVSRSALAALLLAQAAWLGMASYYQAQPLPLFNYSGIGPFALSVMLVVLWAAAVSAVTARHTGLLRVMVLSAAAMLLISLVSLTLLTQFGDGLFETLGMEWLWHGAIALWMLAALARIVRRMHGQSLSGALFLASAYVLASMTLSALMPQGTLYIDAVMVQTSHDARHTRVAKHIPAPAKSVLNGSEASQDGDDEDDGEEKDDAPQTTARLDVEDIYYRQPGLVSHALDGLKPRQPGETSLYFVGFAGDASEREFANEVRYARGLLDRRFNTAGRSLLLLNSHDSVNDTPLANVHNLDAVLQGLSRRMDRQNDVLFIFLSSHGAQDHRLSVNFSPLDMGDLKAEKLKAMLDKSGIRNRVIVVSACYSGGFLDVLRDDNTLILTASSRDHVAYGCGDITEYTYFGEAYFVKALGHHDSFIAAFDEARSLIAEREKNEGEDPSRPQIYVGRNIVKVLEKLKVIPAGDEAEPAGEGVQRCPENCPGEPG
jgi:hypothetical protein